MLFIRTLHRLKLLYISGYLATSVNFMLTLWVQTPTVEPTVEAEAMGNSDLNEHKRSFMSPEGWENGPDYLKVK